MKVRLFVITLLSFLVCFPSLAESNYDVIYDLSIPVIEVVTTDSIEPCYTPVLKDHVSIIDNEYVTGKMIMLHNYDTVYQSGEYVKGESGMKLKVRGNTSVASPQIPYKIKLSKKENLLKYLGVKGSDNKEWVLLKCQYKTVGGMFLSNLMNMEWTPRHTFVNVKINGDYRGLYLLIEAVTKDKKRCSVSSEGFIIEYDAWWKGENYSFESNLHYGNDLAYTFKYPDDDELTDVYVERVREYIVDIENRLATECEPISEKLDLESFAKWELFQDIIGNLDFPGSNIFLYKDTFLMDSTTNDRLKIGPVWDLDWAYAKRGSWSTVHDYYYFGDTAVIKRPLNQREAFVKMYKEEYAKIRPVLPSLAMMLRDSLQYLSDDLDYSVDLCITKNGYTPTAYFESELTKTENWFSERVVWLDSAIATMKPIYGEAKRAERSVRSCDSLYLFSGNLVKSSGLYYDTLSTYLHCDSIIETTVIIDSTKYTEQSFVSCDSVFWGDQMVYSTTAFYDTLTSSAGCDSIVYTQLHIGYTYRDTSHMVACDSFAWRDKVYQESGLYSDTLMSVMGCDSIFFLDLRVNYTKYDTVHTVSCDSFLWHDRWYFETGYYCDTLQTMDACDSIVSLDLTIHRSKTTHLDVVSCDSFVWNGIVYLESGVYSQDFLTEEGCDSVVYVNLMLAYPTVTVIYDTLEWNEDYDKYGFAIPFAEVSEPKSFVFQQNLYTYLGCDSTVWLNLHVNEEDITVSNVLLTQLDLCHGDTTELRFQIATGDPKTYQLCFDENIVRQGGFEYFETPLANPVSFSIPKWIKAGSYYVDLVLKGVEKYSNVERLYFNVGLDKSLLVAERNDMVCCLDTSSEFDTYQWFKNGELKDGRNGSCCYEAGGLSGIYSCRVQTRSGVSLDVCSRPFHSLTDEFTIIATPNPVSAVEQLSVIVTGQSDEELKSAKLLIYDFSGKLLLSREGILFSNTIQLKPGTYLLVVELANGERRVEKIFVE